MKRVPRFINFKILFIICYSQCLISSTAFGQAILQAQGKGNTYELIDSILAPGAHAEETPDQCPIHADFGRHIKEVYDETLKKYVFEFTIHASPDNDRCIKFDRQRVEIKTYSPSPDSLKGTIGETITYKWKFRLPYSFQPSPSFTHIHQIKAVGGDAGEPLFTLSPRFNKFGNTLQLIYTANKGVPATVLEERSLSSFLGIWVEATEVIMVGEKGSYTINITKVGSNKSMLSYSTKNIKTIRPDNEFIRPKWGIYRSLNHPEYLRDESIRFADFSIYEDPATSYHSNKTAKERIRNSNEE